MKLNNDCMREVLIYLESCDYYTSNSSGDVISNPVYLNTISNNFPHYTKHELFYVLQKLDEAGLIYLHSWSAGDNTIDCHVNSISFNGHEFLNHIADEENWSIIKKGLESIRNYSLSAIEAVATGTAQGAIQGYLSSLV